MTPDVQAPPAPSGTRLGVRLRPRRGAGLLLALASGAAFGTSGTFGDGLLRSGWSPGAAVLARIVVAALTLTPFALPQLRRQRAALRRNTRQVLGYGLIGVLGCTFCYFYAIASVPVGVGLLLEYTAAFMVVVWLWLRHGQRPRALTIGGTAAALGGLALMGGITGSGGLDPAGLAWGLGAAVCMTVFMFTCESPQSSSSSPPPDPVPGGGPPEELSPVVLSWAGICVAAVALAALGAAGAVPMAATTAAVSFLGHPVSWIWPVLAVGSLSTGTAFITAVAAVRALGAKLATFLGMSEVLFSVAFAAVMLSQVPTAIQFAGGGLILAGCVLVRADERQHSAFHGRRPAEPGEIVSDHWPGS